MKIIQLSIIMILFLLPLSSFGGKFLEQRQEAARENMRERMRANSVLNTEEEEEIFDLPPIAVHPYKRILPQTKHSLFDEMSSEEEILAPIEREEDFDGPIIPLK